MSIMTIRNKYDDKTYIMKGKASILRNNFDYFNSADKDYEVNLEIHPNDLSTLYSILNKDIINKKLFVDRAIGLLRCAYLLKCKNANLIKGLIRKLMKEVDSSFETNPNYVDLVSNVSNNMESNYTWIIPNEVKRNILLRMSYISNPLGLFMNHNEDAQMTLVFINKSDRDNNGVPLVYSFYKNFPEFDNLEIITKRLELPSRYIIRVKSMNNVKVRADGNVVTKPVNFKIKCNSYATDGLDFLDLNPHIFVNGTLLGIEETPYLNTKFTIDSHDNNGLTVGPITSQVVPPIDKTQKATKFSIKKYLRTLCETKSKTKKINVNIILNLEIKLMIPNPDNFMCVYVISFDQWSYCVTK